MPSKNLILTLGALSGVVPVILLYLASFETPWRIQTWDGNSKEEITFQRRRKNRAIIGFISLGISLSLNIWGILY